VRIVAAGSSDVLRRARELCVPGRRRILGVIGPPGAGKSRLTAELVGALAPAAVAVGMDGFHLANSVLAQLGRRDRKGAADTFDAAGYVALLRRLREPGGEVVYAPEFRREWEEAIAGAVPVAPSVPLVVTEGNYLLVDTGPWAAVRPLLDEVWYLEPDEDVRLDRLVRRHVAYGKSEQAARDWALGSDERNAALIRPTRDRADVVVRG
jgi:pantothenate kinase